jgi:hypothetical protein
MSGNASLTVSSVPGIVELNRIFECGLLSMTVLTRSWHNFGYCVRIPPPLCVSSCPSSSTPHDTRFGMAKTYMMIPSYFFAITIPFHRSIPSFGE